MADAVEEKWVAGFEYPEDKSWIQLDTLADDGAERAAQEIADRGGEFDQLYAEAAYPELKAIWEGASAQGAAPVVVFVPMAGGAATTYPLVSFLAFAAPWDASPELRNMDRLAAEVRRRSVPRVREPDIRATELPLGPALRVHELLGGGEGDDERPVLMEFVTYFVLPPDYPHGLEFTFRWSSPAIGAEMAEMADGMAETLTLRRLSEAARG